jgi:LuxR family transcriptional regulator
MDADSFAHHNASNYKQGARYCVNRGSDMMSWEADLLCSTEGATCEHAVFEAIEAAAQALGFEHCAFALRASYPLTSPKTILLNTCKASWWVDDIGACCCQSEPAATVEARAPSGQPLARPGGMRIEWTQSSFSAFGFAGMLTACSSESVPASRVATHQAHMRRLANVSHQTLFHLFTSKWRGQIELSTRELEVLRWTADGKTSGEIANILAISGNTVNFHIKNAVTKLQTTNKTAAAVRATTLGLLD